MKFIFSLSAILVIIAAVFATATMADPEPARGGHFRGHGHGHRGGFGGGFGRGGFGGGFGRGGFGGRFG